MTRPDQHRTAGLSVVAACAVSVLFMALQAPVLAQDTAGAAGASDAIVASLNPVPQGLACSDAASQAQVSFDFQKPDFDIKQVSLYVDGKGVPEDAVNQQWPRVTLSSGLHPGRNTVEIVATGDNDRSIARQLTVLIGVAAQAGDENAAVVQCDDSRTQVAQTPPPVAQPQQQPQQQVIQQPAPPTTMYVEQPVYVYHEVPAYPVWPVFVPIIPVYIGYPIIPVWYPHRYCPPPVVTYYPYPPPRVPPPVAYRPPAGIPVSGVNTWRTPTPIHGVPTPLQPPAGSGGVSRSPRGGGVVTYYSSQPSNDQRWGVVSDTNAGGGGTRYRTPPPPQRMQPYGNAPTTVVAPIVVAPGNPHGQQSNRAPVQLMNGNPGGYYGAPHQSYVHEAPVQRYEAPHPMPPPRMTAAPAPHAPMHGGWH